MCSRRVKSEEKHYGQRNPLAFCIEKSQKKIRPKTTKIRNELWRTSKEDIQKVTSFIKYKQSYLVFSLLWVILKQWKSINKQQASYMYS